MKSKMKCSLIFRMRCIVFVSARMGFPVPHTLNPRGFMALWGSKADVCCLPPSCSVWLLVCFNYCYGFTSSFDYFIFFFFNNTVSNGSKMT